MRGTFLELAESQYLARDFEARAVEALAHHIGAETAFFAVKGSESTPAVVGIDSESIARAVRAGSRYELELLPVKRAALAGRGAAVDTDVLGEAAVQRQSYFREIVSRANGRHTLMAYLSWRGHVRGTVMLGRSRSSFSAGDVAQLEAVLPELCAARAGYGWQLPEPALPPPPHSGLLERLWPRRGVLAHIATPYGELCVRDRQGFREMVASPGARELVWTRADVNRPSRSGWPYIELFHVAAAIAEQRRRALFIGLGGGVAVRQFARQYPGIAIDVVEHDSHVLDLAREWYDVSAIPGVTFHVADGAEFVRRSAQQWDVIIVDVFGEGFAPIFARPAFFSAAQRVLASGGTLAMNLIGTIDGEGELPLVLAADRGALGAARVLPVLEAEPPCDPRALRNLVAVWSKRRS